MCGRYQFTAEQSAEILHIVQTVRAKYGEYAWTPGEIRPTAMAPVLVAGGGGISPELFRWGFASRIRWSLTRERRPQRKSPCSGKASPPVGA